MSIMKLVTYLKDKDTDEVNTFESYLLDKEQELLCKFRQLNWREQSEIIGEMNCFILKKFQP